MSNLTIQLLEALKPWRNAPAWRIALSGGLDSTVLLHLLAHLRPIHALPPLTALHIHHGLQAVADTWPAHCQLLCDALGVPLTVVRVQVSAGASVERAAREARYEAFEAILQPQEVLFTGQHRDDQAETVLFRLLRGAGVNGLSGMPRERRLGRGVVGRPLLDISRADLEAYAHAHGLHWVEDPSNEYSGFSRNYLRHEVMPVLSRRWPQVTTTLSRAADHCAEAQGLLNELAEQDLVLAAAEAPFAWLGLPSLQLEPLDRLSAARQRNALRQWLAGLTRLPDTAHWAGWEALRDAGVDARPAWRLADGEVHRAGGRIWWLSGQWLRQPTAPITWDEPALPVSLPGNGLLRIEGEVPEGALQVRYRQGAEVMSLAGRGHRDLKRLLNERGVPPFARGRLPLLYQNERLLAVANLEGLDSDPNGRWQLKWLPTSSDQGLS